MTGDGRERPVLVSYAVGWDLASRTPLEPLSLAQARVRDGSGEPYVTVHRVPDRAEPVELHLVAWAASHVGVWAYDDQGRRTREADWRLLEPERLFLRHLAEWAYDSPEEAECARWATHTYQDLFPDGKGRKVIERRNGGSFRTLADLPEGERWCARDRFGARGAGGLFFAEGESGPLRHGEPGHEKARHEEPGHEKARGEGRRGEPGTVGVAPTPLRPPRPARPTLLEELFVPGTRLATSHQPEMTVGEVREIATLRLPSGRLTVADPAYKGEDAGRELVERFVPGRYAVQAAVVAYEYEFMGEHCAVEEPVAVRLRLSDEPVVSWELALAAGDDVRLLRDEEIFGFGTDSAAGSFADASGWEALARRAVSHQDGGEDAAEALTDGHIRIGDDTTGGDLVTFCTGGDGTYPVWLGRSPSGTPVCAVVETAYLPELTLL